MRGRPVKSAIRQNIIEILNFIKRGYGYEIYKIYVLGPNAKPKGDPRVKEALNK